MASGILDPHTYPAWAEDTIKIMSARVPIDVCDRIKFEGQILPKLEGTGPLHNNQTGDRYFDPTIRAVSVRFFEFGWTHDLMKALLRETNDSDEKWKYIVTDLDPVQYCIYDKNDFFEWHSDLRLVRSPIRKVSLVIQLSEPTDHTGGAFEFNVGGQIWQPEAFKPKGSVIVFTSTMLHRVNPIKSGTRHSLTAWFKGPPLR